MKWIGALTRNRYHVLFSKQGISYHGAGRNCVIASRYLATADIIRADSYTRNHISFKCGLLDVTRTIETEPFNFICIDTRVCIRGRNQLSTGYYYTSVAEIRVDLNILLPVSDALCCFCIKYAFESTYFRE